MNGVVEARLVEALSTHLGEILKELFESTSPVPDMIFQALFHFNQDLIKGITHQARNISYEVQQVFSGRMVVTRASEDDPDILGTYGFGLQIFLESGCTTLISSKPITLQGFLD
jgi:hypothetical protein